MEKEEIIRYYDECEVDYRLLWDLNNSHAMHAGYWDEHTKSLRDALRRENEILAEIAGIKETDCVLDAGCGVGGSSLFLAKQYQCAVTGITLCPKQAQKARKIAKDARIVPHPLYAVMDFTCTTFPDRSFDVVWGLESVCHATNKEAFIKEASRLLRPGGRLIIADGFASNPPRTISEAAAMKRWLKGWGVEDLATVDAFKNALTLNGFKDIFFRDITQNVKPSAKRLYLYSWPGVLLSKLGELVGLRNAFQTENLYSARCHYQTLKKGLWLYGIFCAEKQ